MKSKYARRSAAFCLSSPSGKALLALCLNLSFLSVTPLQAQQRTIINQSFEDGTGQPGIGGNAQVSDSTIDGWTSSNGIIEIWGDGAVGGTPSSDQDYFVELNPEDPVQLYQNVCLVNGETLSWSFDHAARSGGPNPQTVVYQVTQANSDTLVQNLDSSSISPPPNAAATTWSTVTGSSVFTGATGNYRIGFRSSNPGTLGNFLDNIQIGLVALAEFEDTSGGGTPSNMTSLNENSTGSLPRVRVSGTVATTVTVPISISGGTATPGVDFTPAVPANITIPAGTYDGVSVGSFFTIPYSITGDTDFEPDETIEFTIGTPSSTALSIGSTTCTPPPLIVATHTIVNDDTTPIDAVDDTPPAVNGATGGTTATVLSTDTLNGTAVDPADINLTSSGLDTIPAAGSITMNAAGEIVIAPGTTAGSYDFTYEICELVNLANCDTAVATVVVDPANLIGEIEEDLTAILEDDLIATLTTISREVSSYSGEASDRLRARSHNRCLADVNARLAVENVLFDTGSAVIKPASNRVLDEITAILGSCPESAFEIAGHTDSDASEAYNNDLSQQRVVAVRRALSERGLDTTGYVARGYGESQPIASNATETGKAQNRRVEFRSLEKDDYLTCPLFEGHS